mgnify:CR=1 FL=1
MVHWRAKQIFMPEAWLKINELALPHSEIALIGQGWQ